MKKTLPIAFAIILLLLTSYIIDPRSDTYGFSSSSDNFKLEGEFGIFGGAKSSTNYKITDTGGGFAIGFGSSANYGSGSGFQYVLAEVPELIFTISSTSVDLGSLSGTPKGVSHTITVTTNAREGYKVTAIEDGNLRYGANNIDDVAGGTVDPNTEEYGLATSKTGQYFAQDTDCANTPFNATAIDGTARQVASADAPIDADQTTLCYSAAISGATPAGSYQHVLTYIATGTF